MNESIPKNFILKCQKCKWFTRHTGLNEDLKEFYEIKKSCDTCGGNRRFKCKKCKIGILELIRNNEVKFIKT